jgi:hypothetical protein
MPRPAIRRPRAGRLSAAHRHAAKVLRIDGHGALRQHGPDIGHAARLRLRPRRDERGEQIAIRVDRHRRQAFGPLGRGGGQPPERAERRIRIGGDLGLLRGRAPHDGNGNGDEGERSDRTHGQSPSCLDDAMIHSPNDAAIKCYVPMSTYLAMITGL